MRRFIAATAPAVSISSVTDLVGLVFGLGMLFAALYFVVPHT